jgi:hypothetical protein
MSTGVAIERVKRLAAPHTASEDLRETKARSSLPLRNSRAARAATENSWIMVPS